MLSELISIHYRQQFIEASVNIDFDISSNEIMNVEVAHNYILYSFIFVITLLLQDFA